MIFDIDHFKSINDTYGHLAGDKALKTVAHIIAGNVRASDTVARYGGEEFGVILTGLSQPQACGVVEYLLEHIRVLARQNDARCPCTASAGLAEFDARMASHHAWLQAADRCLYGAKTRGRDRLVVTGEDCYASRPAIMPESAR